jgi:alpha/beta superfamily hydrolase
MTEAVTIESTDGLSLEGAVDEPAVAAGTLLLCHPHPKMGGTMNAPLLLALRDAVMEQGWRAVRFNFRGVGGSEGDSGEGDEEINDAVGALGFARSFGDRVAIAGWSFGAAVAIRVAAEHEVVACVAIAPAIERREGITAGVRAARPAVPTLVIVGANDVQVDPTSCRRWSESIPGARFVEVTGANHFFWAKYEQLADLVVGFLSENL